MSAAITAAGVAVVGGAVIANQQKQAAKGAANAQKSSVSAATDVERERLQMEYQQYQEQMAEYQRKQAMLEKQQAQTIQNLAPYMQAGQGALYEMMALTGLSAPQGATTIAPAPMTAGGGGIMQRTYTAPTTPTGGRMGILGGSTVGIQGTERQPLMTPAAQEFTKGGRSLSSKAWQTVSPDASPRAKAAATLRQVREEMPSATADQTQQEAINRLNAEVAQAAVPTISPAQSPYAGMTGEEAQSAAIEKVAQSPLLQELMAQGETGLLQNVAATGGLRGGRTQAALAQFRPAMLQSEIDKLYSRLSGISGIGQQSILASPTTSPGAIPTYSAQSQIPGLLTQAGAVQAGGILSQAQAQQDLYGNIGKTVGWGLEKYSQGGFFPSQTTPTTTPATAGLGIGNPANY